MLKNFNLKQIISIISILTVMLIAAMENMITSTILPSVISSIGGLELYPWISSIFMFTSTVTLPVYGKLSDIYGHKKFTLIAIFIFLLGSVFCGFSQTMIQLIISRGIQGMGAGGLITMSFIMFGIIFPAEERAKMQSLLTSMWAISSILGPLAGSFFVSTMTWRWAFFFNVPIGIISALLIIIFLNIPHDIQEKRYIDYRGIILFSILMLLFLSSFLNISQGVFSIFEIISLIVSGFIFFYLIRYEKSVPEPILPVNEFSNKTFTFSVMINFFAAFCLFSSINFIPLLIQGVAGGSPAVVGRSLTAFSLGWVTGSIFAGRVVKKIGFKNLVLAGSILMVFGFVLLSVLDISFSSFQISGYISLCGLGMGILTNTTLNEVQGTASKQNIGIITASIQLFRSIGGTLGVSVLGGLQLGFLKHILKLNGKLPENINTEVNKILDPVLRSNLSVESLNLFSDSLYKSIHYTFIFALGISLLNLFLSIKHRLEKN